MVLFVQQAELYVELPHSDTHEGVDFARGVEFFYPEHMGTDRYQTIQHSDYQTIPIVNKVLKPMFCYCS